MKLRKQILLTAGVLGVSLPAFAQTFYQCIPCENGTYSESNQCKTCPKGSYCYGGEKYTCVAGKYNSSTGKSSSDACLSCSSGTYSSAGASSCTNCLTTGVSACDSKTGKATSCNAGYGYSSGTCTACSGVATSTSDVKDVLFSSLQPDNTKYISKSSPGGTSACSTNWQSHKTVTSSSTFNLNAGSYLFVLIGGGGGGGGAHNGSNHSGKYGGFSEVVSHVINISSNTAFSCTIGSGGSGGTSDWDYNSKNPGITAGKAGGNTSCKIMSTGTTYTAKAGGGGAREYNGSDATSYRSWCSSYGCGGRGGYESGADNYHGASGTKGVVYIYKM